MIFIARKNRLYLPSFRRIALWTCWVLLVAFSSLSPNAGAANWPHEDSDLEPDPEILFGTLPNGMRYLVDENAEPPGRISMRIVFQAGSLMESEGEEGIAHFLEHLAFNGTERFPEDEMIRYLQRLGMAFGPDTNANTGFDRTLYQLDLPNNDRETFATGLSLLRDYASRLLLLPEEIEQERGIILAEKQARDSVAYRTRKAETAFILDGLTYPERWPIGTEAAIRSVNREQFTAFYETWYRPDRTILVVVGDLEADAAARAIEAEFENWTPSTPAPPDPETGVLTEIPSGTAKVHNAAEAPHSDCVIYGVQRYQRTLDTLESRRRETLENLAHAMLSNRFARIARTIDSPIQLGYSWSTDYYKGARVAAVGAYGQPDQWRDVVPIIEQELRRALVHGFTEPELAEARANLLNAARQAAAEAPSRDSKDLANAYANATNRGLVLRSPAQELERVETLLNQLTLEEVEGAFSDLWTGVPRRYWVTGAFGESAPDDETVRAVFAESSRIEVEPQVEEAVGEFPYEAAELPGKTVSREDLAELGATRVTFENGLVAFLKPTEFEANSIQMQIRLGEGLKRLPEDRPGLQRLATATWVEAGLGKLNRDQIERSLAGKMVGVDFVVDDNAFVLNGATRPEDLELQLRLATAYLTDPGFREEALARFRRSLPGMYREMETTWRGALDREVRPWLRGGDRRFVVPAKAVLETYDLQSVEAWIGRPLLEQAGVEMVLVGDFETEAAIAAIARTLGAVKRSPGSRVDGYWDNPPGYPRPGEAKTVRYESEVRQGLLVMAWPTGGMRPIERTRRLNMLANVIDDRVRVKIRETFGDTYAYGVYNQAARAYDHGLFTIILQIDPDRMKTAEEAVRGLVSDLVENGIDEDEFIRAREPLMQQLETMERDNAYWLRVFGGASRRPMQLEWARGLRKSYEAIGRAELESLAETVLGRVEPWVARVESGGPTSAP